MGLRITKAPKGMPVDCWSIVGPHSPTITGFNSPEAAQAWGSEWGVCPHSIIAPVCGVGPATSALAAYEAAMDGLRDSEDEPEPPMC